MTLTEICNRIQSHLTRFSRDPELRETPKGYARYFYPRCYRGGAYARIRYVSYQHTSSLKRAEAEAYLDWLNAGNVGTHYEWRRR